MNFLRAALFVLPLAAGLSCRADDAAPATPAAEADAPAAADATPAATPAANGMVVLIPASIPYAATATSDLIRSSCNFPTYLPQQIIEAAQRYNITVQTSSADLSGVSSGRVLQMQTLYLYGMAGSSYTGAKSARIRGELRQDGKPIGDFIMQRDTKGGLFGFSACGALERDADALARDVARWLSNPQVGTRQGVR